MMRWLRVEREDSGHSGSKYDEPGLSEASVNDYHGQEKPPLGFPTT